MIKLKKILAEDKYDHVLGDKLAAAIEALLLVPRYQFKVYELIDDDRNAFSDALTEFMIDVSDDTFKEFKKETTNFKNNLKSQLASDLKLFDSKIKKIEAEYSKHKKR